VKGKFYKLLELIKHTFSSRSRFLSSSSAKNIENLPEMNLKCMLHSLKFSFRDTKENILWGVLKACFTSTIELVSFTKGSQLLPPVGNILCNILSIPPLVHPS